MYLLFQTKFRALKKEERLYVLLDLLKTCGGHFVLPIPERESLCE